MPPQAWENQIFSRLHLSEISSFHNVKDKKKPLYQSLIADQRIKCAETFLQSNKSETC